MGLQAQVAADVKGKGKAAEEGSASTSGWSPKAEERERNLRARKEKLVLEARRYVRLFAFHLVAARDSLRVLGFPHRHRMHVLTEL